ncbi:DUF6361 family protein [Sorangium sp. So ce117]|uniref:DUF6361 family protein n=1 Tax=Sorangium sp. So ce117 TaxID=3133277 RepID=UPI003F5F6A3F
MASPQSIAGWIDISPAALRKLRAELELHDKSVLDEMGVGAIHTGYADLFFPGTSVLHTRARYLLFVPWIYLGLAAHPRARAERVRELKEKAELWLTGCLRAHAQENDDGIIGGRVYPEPPAQPPDFAYWSALREYRLYDGVPRAQLLARWDRARVMLRKDVHTREDRVDQQPLGLFDVPSLPEWWMQEDADVSFQLESHEAEFLRERLAQRRPPCLLGVAAALLGKRVRPTARTLWGDPFMRRAAEVFDRDHSGPDLRPASAAAALQRADGASALAELVRAIYAALVEMLREQDLRAASRLPLPEDHAHYREYLRSYWEEDDGDTVRRARDLPLQGLKADIHLPGRLPELLAHVQARVSSIRRASEVQARLLDSTTLELFTSLEWDRKRTRARLPRRDGRGRREGFGKGTVRVADINYRWPMVSRMLRDIQEGLPDV